MKRFIALFFAAVSILVFSACAPTQEMRDSASFDGLTKYYIMPSSGGDILFRQLGGRARFDNMLNDAIKNFLSERGFVAVDTPEEAQFSLRPVYSEWITQANNPNLVDFRLPDVDPIGFPRNPTYLNLSIEAHIPNINSWAWRGFSPTRITRENIGPATIRTSVRWALQHFPPERYPSSSQLNEQNAPEAVAPANDAKPAPTTEGEAPNAVNDTK